MSSKKFCPDCGDELDENSEFCTNCGKDLKNNRKSKINNSNLMGLFLDNKKFLLLTLVGIIVLIMLVLLMGNGIGNSNLMDLTSISMDVGYSDTPFGGAVESLDAMNKDYAEELAYLKKTNPEQYQLELEMSGMTEDEINKYANSSDKSHTESQVMTAVTKFSLMPKETINRVTGLKLENVEVFFENGDKENWGSFKFNPKNTYVQDKNYNLQISKTLKNTGKTLDDYCTIKHIKADIVINTTDETNKVIGHIDNDITPNK